MRKRILSVLLALCMVICLVPTSVFAEGVTSKKVETQQELVAALADDTVDVIKLGSDIAIDATLNITRTVTLDLVGYMLEMKGSGSVITVKNGGHLTLNDSDLTSTYYFTPNADGLWKWGTSGTKTVNGGVIYGGTGTEMYYSTYGGGVLIEDGCQFTMNGGSIEDCTANGGGAVFANGGTFELTNGEIKNCTATDGSALYLRSRMNANGGTVDGTVVLDVKNNGDKGIIQGSGSTATHFSGAVTNYGEIKHGTFSGTVTLGNSTLSGKITGGTFNGPVTTDSEGEAKISGGVFNKTVTINRGEITNGTFNKDVVVYNALASFSCTKLTGGTYNGLIINKSAYAAFVGAHSSLGIVGEKPSYNPGTYFKVTFEPAGGEMDYPVRYFFEDGNISSEIKPAPARATPSAAGTRPTARRGISPKIPLPRISHCPQNGYRIPIR